MLRLASRPLSRLASALPLLCLFASSPTAAQPARVALRDLLAEALSRNPEIAAAQKRYEAARQRPAQASSLPDPMFSPGYQSNGRPWPGAGLGVMPTSQIGFMVSQQIPFPGKRKLAAAIAEREAEAEFHNYTQSQLSLLARLSQAYYRLAFLYSARDVLTRNQALLQRLHEAAAIRYAAGEAPQQDVLKAQTQLSLLAARALQLEAEQRAREAELNALLARPPLTPLGRPYDLTDRPYTHTFARLWEAALRHSPQLRRDEKMIERAQLSTALARKSSYPDVTLNGGYFNMGAMADMYMFRADFSVPLYFFRKQRAAVAEQAQLLSQSRREWEAAALELRSRLEEDHLTAESSARLAHLYRTTILPQALLTSESSLAAYQTGAADFSTLLMNYAAVLEYEMNYYEQLLNLHLALSRMEEITGERLLD